MTDIEQLNEKMMAINEALVIGSVRQHELIEEADALNVRLQDEISERKQAEEELRQAKAQLTDRAGQLEGLVAQRTSDLAASNQQLETFVYSIAHDLRAPLRVMQGFSTMLVETAGATLNETAKDCAMRINKAAKFMDALLVDLLTFARVSQQQVDLTRVSLKMAVESVLLRLQPDIEEKKAIVQAADSWPAVLANEATLVQVLFNLVSNCLKFVVPGARPRIRLRAETRGKFIRVWVEDDGPGIAFNHQAEVFRLFTRLDGEKHAGTGVGLAIVQKGVERMGGRVGVVSTQGQGSRFWLELRPSP